MNPIIVALDRPDLDGAARLARTLVDDVGGFKVGLELLMGVGPQAIESIAELGKPVFADAKLHDIPNTVGRAAARIRDAGARWLTVHASGGREMIAAASQGMGGSGVLAVTVLTSLASSDLADTGVDATIATQVARLATLGSAAHAEGVVCSPAEISLVKEQQPSLRIFTPGVRPSGSSRDDQKRVATPEKARADGADYLVIGRPITNADDPALAARTITASLATLD